MATTKGITNANILQDNNAILYRNDTNDAYPRGRIYLSKSECNAGSIRFVEGIKKMVFLVKQEKTKSYKYSPTSIYNSWLGGMSLLAQQYKWSNIGGSSYGNTGKRGVYEGTIGFMDSVLKICLEFKSISQKKIKYYICHQIIQVFINIPMAQMEGAQGEALLQSTIAGNTIVTRSAEANQVGESGVDEIKLPMICSTEQVQQFESVVNRWMALPVIEISTANNFNTIVRVYNIPSFLYKENKAPNLMPFQNFVYGRYDIEFKFVVNANRFHVGKVVVAVKYDSYQVDSLRNDVVAMLSRPHIILDLAANNEGTLRVPFKYHRTFLRNMKTANSTYGLKDAQYATLVVSILSPLGAVAGAATSMDIRPFYRIIGGQFTGMTYQTPVAQMEKALLEGALKFAGRIINMDKPYQSNIQQVVLRPRMNFQSGIGASDCVPMRIDPLTQTSYLSDHIYPEDPTDTLQIARIWGFTGTFDWSTSQNEGYNLFDAPIDPLFYGGKNWSGSPAPLNYIAAMYQFWSGPLEYRFDFVSNAFHSGAVMISAEYGKSAANVEEASSTYTKTFHLGEQKSVTFVAPYIYDTVWRRMNNAPYCVISTSANPDNRKGQNAVFRNISSRIRMHIVNRLVPVQSVPQTIKVLVFIRAGENFQFHSPIMTNMVSTDMHTTLTDFPGAVSYQIQPNEPLVPKMREGAHLQVSHTWLQGKTPGDIYSGLSGLQVKTQATSTTTLETAPLFSRPSHVKQVVEETTWQTQVPKGVDFKFYDSSTRKSWAIKDSKNFGDYVQMPEILEENNGYYRFGPRIVTYKYDTRKGKVMVDGQWVVLPPHAQMDNGSEDALPNTADFSQGIARDTVQTIEKHTNIKDLLRRPVCIIDSATVNATPSDSAIYHYYIPCMPPSIMMTIGDEPNRDFSPCIGRSYHSHLMNLFRFWRGSQRYTIITHRTSGAPIYISYIPHSGAMLCGNVKFDNNVALGLNSNPSSFGLATEVMIPSLNSTCAIEVPFEIETNWCLTWCEDWSRNFSWRDKGEYNVGHIVIWSKEKSVIDVFWSAGDDYAVSNYYGPGRVKAPFSDYYYKDDFPHPQMEDFQVTDTRGNFFSRVFDRIKLPLGLAAATSIPVVGPSVAVFGAGLRIEQTATQIENGIQDIGSAAREVSTTMAGVGDLVAMIKMRLDGIFCLTGNICQAVVNAIIDIVSNIGNWNPRNIAMSILRLIVNLCSVSLDKILVFLQPLTSVFNRSPRTQAEDPIEQISGSFWTEDRVKETFKVVVAIFSALVGSVIYSVDKSWKGICKAILGSPFSLQSVSMANGVLRFLDITFNIIREGVLWVVGKTSFEAKAINMLRLESPMVATFCKESQILLNESNKVSMVHPGFRLRYWANVIRACEIQRRLIAIPQNRVSPVLIRMCADVIKAGKESMADLRSSPIKYEPFVICLQGAPGIGKSMLVRTLATRLLHEIGMSKYNGDPLFYRISGSRFWNGYTDQPVVIFDDFLNVSEQSCVATALNELYQLKSCATFVPEQAAIEEKKIRATPRIVILLCNNAFPDQILVNMVESKEAVYRRRDLLVQAMINPSFDGCIREMSDDDSKKCAHLEFRLYNDVLNENSLTTSKVDYLTFEQFVVDSFKLYDAQELINVKRRMTSLFSFFQDTDMPNLRDPFSIFYEGLIYVDSQENQHLPSERLECVVRTLVAGLQDVEPPSEVRMPPKPVNPWVVPQMEISTIAYGAMGVATAVPALGLLSNYVLDWLKSRYVAVSTECRVCLMNVPAYVVCAQSYNVNNLSNESLHFVCRACYTQLSVTGTYSCPTCRDTAAPYQVVAKELFDPAIMVSRLYGLGYSISSICKQLRMGLSDTDLKALHFGFVGGLANIAVVVNRVHLLKGSRSALSCLLSNVTMAGSMFLSVLIGGKGFNSPVTAKEVVVPSLADVPNIIPYKHQPADLTDRIMAFNADPMKTRSQYTALKRDQAMWLRTEYPDYIDSLQEFREKQRLTVEEIEYNRLVLRYNERMLQGRSQIVESDLLVRIRRLKATLPENAAPQMSDEDIDVRPPYPIIVASPLRANDIFSYVMNERAIKLPVIEVQEVCLHNLTKDNPGLVRYYKGKYSVLLDGGWVEINSCACAQPDCCWVEYNDYVEWCRKIFNEFKSSWLKWIISLPEENKIQTIKDNLPEYAWPSWIAMETVEPLQDMTQENWFESLNIHPMLKYALTGLAVCATALVVCKTVSSFLRALIPEPQIIPSGDAVIRHFKPKIERITRGTVSPQAEFTDVMIGKVVDNYFILYVERSGELKRRLIGIGVKQRLGIIPRHYYEYLLKMFQHDDCSLYFSKVTSPGVRVKLAFDKQSYWASETADICVVQFPASVNMFKNIVKFMAKDQDLQGKMANTGVLVQPKLNQQGVTTVIPLNIKGYVRKQYVVSEDGGYYSEHCLMYNYSCSGACGSLVIKDHSQRPLVAMHFAGTGVEWNGVGYGTILTQEMFSEFECEVSAQALEVEEPALLDLNEAKMHLPIDSNVEYLGVLPRSLTPHTPYKSKIKPSLLQGVVPWETCKEPAILSGKDPRYTFDVSPLVAGCAKHGYITDDFPNKLLKRIGMLRMQMLYKMEPKVVPCNRLSIREAIVGFVGIPYYDPLHLDTSAGWPLCAGSKTLKMDYCTVDRDNEGRVIDVALEDRVVKMVTESTDLRRKGIVPCTIFVDTLKDEKRKKDKAMKFGGTRVFCASPFAFSICMRQNFLHFVAAYMHNRWTLKHAVGINLQGYEVGELVSSLLRVGSNIVTIDYANFGPGFNAGVANVAAQNMIKWTLENVDNVDEVELRVLMEENINSVHAMHNIVYRQKAGSPSGSPITVIINSEVNLLYLMAAWDSLIDDDDKWTKYEEHVAQYVYGDDLIMSVSDAYIQRYNAVTITNFFKRYNIVATDASKSDHIVPYTGIEDAVFLKCNFVVHPERRGEWLAKLDLNSVLDTPLWIKEEIDFKMATRVNAEAGVRAAYGHGRDFYLDYITKINKGLAKVGIDPILLTWDDIDEQYFGK